METEGLQKRLEELRSLVDSSKRLKEVFDSNWFEGARESIAQADESVTMKTHTAFIGYLQDALLEPDRPNLLRDVDDAMDQISAATANLATDEQPILREGPNEGISNNEVWVYQELAVTALGKLRGPMEIGTVAAVLKQQEASPVHGTVCEALSQAGGKESIAALSAAMRDPAFENTPAAFKALVALGSPDAIPLAIARIDPKLEAYSGGWLVPELQHVTGQNLGANREEWTEWWQSKR